MTEEEKEEFIQSFMLSEADRYFMTMSRRTLMLLLLQWKVMEELNHIKFSINHYLS